MASSRPHTTGSIGRGLGRILFAPLASFAASLPVATSRVRLPFAALLLGGVLLTSGFLAGALLSPYLQGPSTGAPLASAPLTGRPGNEVVADAVSRLESEQAQLKERIAGLRAQLSEVQGTHAMPETSLQDMQAEVARQRATSGVVALRGPGVVATLDDSIARSIPENEDPDNYILHEYDLRDVLNTFWVAGAEAISINGERIVSNTSLYCVGTTVICNTTRLSPPYEVRAIGDPQALAAAFRGAPQMSEFNRRAQIYDLPVKIEESLDVLVPAYTGSLAFKYAELQEQKTEAGTHRLAAVSQPPAARNRRSEARNQD